MTIVGFLIAFEQLRRVQSATAAASTAVRQMTGVIRAQEQNTKINTALDHLKSADGHLRRANSEAALAYLLVSWQALLEARELTSEDGERNRIAGYVVVVRRIYNDLRSPVQSPKYASRAAAERLAELDRVLDGLGDLAARVQIRLSKIGAVRNE